MAKPRRMTADQKERALQQLKLLAEEHDEPIPEPPDIPTAPDGLPCPVACASAMTTNRLYTDAQLLELLAMHGYDARACAYTVLLRKAENSEVALPGGLRLPNQADYYLRLASTMRRNQGHAIGRADGT